MKKDERVVQDIETCLVKFDRKPVEASKPVLCILQSAIVASHELKVGLNKTMGEEKEQILSFLIKEFIVKSLRSVTPFLKTQRSTSQMVTSNKYWVIKKRLIKRKKIN